MTASRSVATPRLADWRALEEGAPALEVEWCSIAELFTRGNYATVARKGGEQDWQKYAALGLVGKTGEALEGLARFHHPEADFYAAVARWIDGEDDAVPGLLERISTEHARNLLALLRKPQIEVLAQWPWRRDGCSDLLGGAAADARFHVANISFHPDDLPNKPYADVRDYCGTRGTPDFYICTMVEWHLVPPNLPQLACPLFGQTADYDLHIQTVYPWLGLFDALLVTDPSEWRDVSQLVRSPVYTFPKSFGVPDGLPPLRQGEREIDVYLSGTMLHPYHPDKAELLHQLLEVSGLRIKVISGFKAAPQYYDDLSRSKSCVAFVRHPTALPTRGLEALAMGCTLVVQEDSVLTLFAGREQGVLTYRLERGDLGAALREIAADGVAFARRSEAGAKMIRADFSLARVASQYLRFLTFLAAKPRGPRAPLPSAKLYQKRCVLKKGWLPSDDLFNSPVLSGMAVHNQRQLQDALTPQPTSPHALIDLARESVLANCLRAEAGLIPVPQWLAFLCKVYQQAREAFPRSLVARFNAIRVMLHFGTPERVTEALALLDETLGLPPSHWQIDAMEDVFPWDFYPQFFNYRSYFDRVTAHLMHGSPVESDLCRLILASLHAYRGFYPASHGFYSQSFDDFQKAAALDPDFPYFRLWYAEQLLHRGLHEDREVAGRLLRELSNGSLVFQEALELLEKAGELTGEASLRAINSRQILDVRESIAIPKLMSDVPETERRRREDMHFLLTELNVLRLRVQGMESSKFWKLREAWFVVKRRLRLGRRTNEG